MGLEDTHDTVSNAVRAFLEHGFLLMEHGYDAPHGFLFMSFQHIKQMATIDCNQVDEGADVTSQIREKQ